MIDRALIHIITMITFIIPACAQRSQPVAIIPNPTAVYNPVFKKDFSGRVIDINGLPISGATVSTDSSETLSDEQGWFNFTSAEKPQWITVNKTGFISRTRAAQPGTPVLLRISPDDGKTIVINFGGDTMFGRRFFDPNEDGNPSDGLLPINPTIQDHIKLLTPIQPLMEGGDLTVVNLESALSNEPFFSQRDPRPTTFHPYKEFVYASSPSGIFALKHAGVDVVDTGNNHIYDMLENGLADTLSALDQANIAHFGSGPTEEAAWAPKMVQVKGQTIGFIGCTTIWTPIPPVTGNDISYVASDLQHKGGAAHCNTDKLYTTVINAKRNADLVVVMIHGGFEYDPVPSKNIANLSKVAKSAGATLIINGHPHVPGGFIWENESLVAQTMGNFIFDQTIWSTFKSYMLTVYIQEGKVIRAFVEPLMVENYIAHGITGELANYVTREAAGWNPGPFIVENGAMEVDINHVATVSNKTVTMDGGTGTIIPISQGQWLSGYQGSGSLLLGRDLLWIGSFENRVIGNEPGSLPLWKQDPSTSIQVGTEYAYEGEVGIRLLRGSGNDADAVTTNLHRILVNPGDQLTITGMVRESQGAVTSLQVSLYPDTFGHSSDQILTLLNVKEFGVWESFRLDVQIPEGIVAMEPYFKLSPPVTGISTADFDNIRIIEWAPTKTPLSVLYNFAYLTGTGDLTFSQSLLPGWEDGQTIPK